MVCVVTVLTELCTVRCFLWRVLWFLYCSMCTAILLEYYGYGGGSVQTFKIGAGPLHIFMII